TVNLTLSNPTVASLGSPSSSVIDINEDADGPPTVQFSSSLYSVNETGGSALITVTLNQTVSQNVTVQYATSNGSAIAGTDYTTTTGTLTILAGQTSGTFSVPILDDNTSSETSPETVNLTLSNPSGAGLGSPSTSVIDINEDSDAPPTVQFSTPTFSASETGSSALITVTLSNPSAVNVSVQYATSNGTASAGKDYTTTSGTLTIPAGQTSGSFSVPILDDNAVNEPNPETVNLTLSNPQNATLGSQSQSKLAISEDSDGGSNLPAAFTASSNCNCGCTNEAGSLLCISMARTGQQIGQSTVAPVRYADGVVTIAETDLHSDGFGFPWGQTRSWTNGQGYTQGGDNGNGWVDTYIPHLIQADGSTNNTLI